MGIEVSPPHGGISIKAIVWSKALKMRAYSPHCKEIASNLKRQFDRRWTPAFFQGDSSSQ